MIGMPSGLIDCAPQIASDRPSESDRSRCTAVDLYSDPFCRVEDTDADERGGTAENVGLPPLV